MGDGNPHITIGDYRRLKTLGEIFLGFQPANPLVFDIKYSELNTLKADQFSGEESKDYKANLTNFLEACGTTNPPRLSESEKRLRLFGYSIGGRDKDCVARDFKTESLLNKNLTQQT